MSVITTGEKCRDCGTPMVGEWEECARCHGTGDDVDAPWTGGPCPFCGGEGEEIVYWYDCDCDEMREAT